MHQQDDYYPFGFEINRTPYTPKNYYLYNKKELQPEFTEYDYGARFYDPVIGRWNVIDELAESFESTSPYAYVLNNPINLGDADGRDTIHLKEVLIIAPKFVPPPPPPAYEPLQNIEPPPRIQLGPMLPRLTGLGLFLYLLFSPQQAGDPNEDAKMKEHVRVFALEEAIEKVLKDAEHIGETGNGHDEYKKDGGSKKANEDFDNIVNPKTVQTMKDGKGRYGETYEGTPVNVRDKSSSQRGNSSGGDPTLEIQNANGKWVKVRYP